MPETPDDIRARRLKAINAKGMEVAERLAALMAHKDVSLDDFDLIQDDDRGVKKEARLRAYLATINAARARLLGDGYGHCTDCDAPVAASVLSDSPWWPTCPACS